MLAASDRLESIYSRYKQDPAFNELKKTATQIVKGRGSLEPQIVLVGEAPGAEEDKTGKPFVGRSGKFLETLLSDIDRYYITNIVKFRPPNNRDPKPAEVSASVWYLRQELNILKPKVLVTLGRFSMNVFFPLEKITNVHGKVLDYRSNAVVPLYHPAVALYNPSMREVLVEDFKIIRSLLEKE